MSVEMVSDSTFQKSVIDASQEKLVVVEFSTVDKTTKRDPSVLNASGKMDAVIDELTRSTPVESYFAESRSN